MKVLSVTGGKGGIGKTTLSVNLALSLAKAGKKIMIFDADLGLANVDVLMGVKPAKTIYDFIKGTASLEEVCVKGPYGITIVPSPSGIQDMADLKSDKLIEIVNAFSTITENIDLMLVDMASGISRQVIDLTHAAQNIMLVICNDPSSLVDSYAVIKILHLKHARNSFGIVVNQVKNLKEGYSVFLNFQQTLAKFFNINLEYQGFIPSDDYIKLAARENMAVVEKFPNSPSATAFRNLANGVYNWMEESQPTGGIQYFFEKLVNANTEKELMKCEE